MPDVLEGGFPSPDASKGVKPHTDLVIIESFAFHTRTPILMKFMSIMQFFMLNPNMHFFLFLRLFFRFFFDFFSIFFDFFFDFFHR